MKLKRACSTCWPRGPQFEAPVSLVEAEFAAIWRQVEAEKAAGEVRP